MFKIEFVFIIFKIKIPNNVLATLVIMIFELITKFNIIQRNVYAIKAIINKLKNSMQILYRFLLS
jgi:hypothetical protein